MLKNLQNRIFSKLEEGLSPGAPQTSLKHQAASLAAQGLGGTLWRILLPALAASAAIWILFILGHAILELAWPLSECQAACFEKSHSDCCFLSQRMAIESLLFALLIVACSFAAAYLQYGNRLQQSALASALLLVSVLIACLLLTLPFWLMAAAAFVVPLCGFWGYRLALKLKP